MYKLKTVIEKAKKLAEDNYDNGYDAFVECYDDEDWEKFVKDHNGKLQSWSEVKARMKEMVVFWADRRADGYW